MVVEIDGELGRLVVNANQTYYYSPKGESKVIEEKAPLIDELNVIILEELIGEAYKDYFGN